MDTVVTSALLTNGTELRPPAVRASRLDLMRKTYNMKCLYRPLIRVCYLDYRVSTCPALDGLSCTYVFFMRKCLLHLGWGAFKLAQRPVHKIPLLSEFFCARHCTWQLARWRTATNSEGLEPRSVRTRCHFRRCRGNCCEPQSGAD